MSIILARMIYYNADIHDSVYINTTVASNTRRQSRSFWNRSQLSKAVSLGMSEVEEHGSQDAYHI